MNYIISQNDSMGQPLYLYLYFVCWFDPSVMYLHLHFKRVIIGHPLRKLVECLKSAPRIPLQNSCPLMMEPLK